MLGRENLPKYHKGITPIKASDLNKLRLEVSRLGKVKAAPPLAVRSDASGVTISLAAGTLLAEVVVGNYSGSAGPGGDVSNVGAPILANASGLYNGYQFTFDSTIDPPTNPGWGVETGGFPNGNLQNIYWSGVLTGPCWLNVIDRSNYNSTFGIFSQIPLVTGDKYIGYLVGTYDDTSGGGHNKRPVFSIYGTTNRVFYGVAQSASSGGHVTCKMCDQAGGNVISSPTVVVGIQTGSSGRTQSMNVASGQIIQFRYAFGPVAGNQFALASPECVDEPVGTLRWTTNSSAPQGWANADGTANSSANGGSGTNFKNCNLRYTGMLGGGGNDTQTTSGPTGTVSVAAGSDYGVANAGHTHTVDVVSAYQPAYLIERLNKPS